MIFFINVFVLEYIIELLLCSRTILLITCSKRCTFCSRCKRGALRPCLHETSKKPFNCVCLYIYICLWIIKSIIANWLLNKHKLLLLSVRASITQENRSFSIYVQVSMETTTTYTLKWKRGSIQVHGVLGLNVVKK